MKIIQICLVWQEFIVFMFLIIHIRCNTEQPEKTILELKYNYTSHTDNSHACNAILSLLSMYSLISKIRVCFEIHKVGTTGIFVLFQFENELKLVISDIIFNLVYLLQF